MFLKDTNVDRLQKILSKYELFKKIINIPGDICECGVFKGSGIFTWVKLVMLFKPNNNFKVVGFDFFEKKVKTKSKNKLDKKVLKWHEVGTTTQSELIKKCKEWNFKNLKLYAGDVKKTTKKYANESFGSRIAFDNEGYLYFSAGERGERDINPQDITRDNGKIYRLNEDGSIPNDNPFSSFLYFATKPTP